jgi:hypothetical protein
MAFGTVRRIASPLLVAVIVLAAARNSSAEGWAAMPHLRPAPSFVVWEAAKSVLWSFLGVPQGKSGSSLDPNGGTPPGSGTGGSTAVGESGSSLDPNGKK